MKRPHIADLDTAAAWLECNEGDNGESEACSRVATWLTAYAIKLEERAAARKVGCTVKYFRKYMADKHAAIEKAEGDQS